MSCEERKSRIIHELEWSCKARTANTGANDPAECDWPYCGCDPHANRVIPELQECGWQSPGEAGKQAAALHASERTVAALRGALEDAARFADFNGMRPAQYREISERIAGYIRELPAFVATGPAAAEWERRSKSEAMLEAAIVAQFYSPGDTQNDDARNAPDLKTAWTWGAVHAAGKIAEMLTKLAERSNGS